MMDRYLSLSDQPSILGVSPAPHMLLARSRDMSI